MKIIVFGVLCFALLSCGNGNSSGDWNENEKDRFLEMTSNLFTTYDIDSNFSKEEKNSICNCALERVMSKYKNLQEAESKLTSNHKQAKRIFNVCVENVTGELFRDIQRESYKEEKKEFYNEELKRGHYR